MHVYRTHLLLTSLHLAGERMQVHVMPQEDQDVRYYSRRAIEHGEHSHYTVLDKFVTKQLCKRAVILDAEVVVWNKVRCGLCCGSCTCCAIFWVDISRCCPLGVPPCLIV